MGPDDWPDDLDFIGIAEDEVIDKETNTAPEPEDVTPETLEDEGDLV